MASPIIQATLQACVLSATSNIVAQYISAYRSDTQFTIDYVPILQFVLFTALNCPPNYLWQQLLEATFPGRTLQPTPSAIAAASRSDEKTLDSQQTDHTLAESHLNITNTIVKFLLDQSVGAAVNTVLFSFVMAGFQGANYTQATQIAKQDFWPIVKAGWKLWPAVSAINYTLVKTVEGRTLVGSLAGVGWSIYLSLIAGAARE